MDAFLSAVYTAPNLPFTFYQFVEFKDYINTHSFLQLAFNVFSFFYYCFIFFQVNRYVVSGLPYMGSLQW